MSGIHAQSFWFGVFVVYGLVAIMTGTAMHRAIPALNSLGGVYVGLTWPGAMFCAAIQIDGCTVLPPAGSALAKALFTFSEAPHDQP